MSDFGDILNEWEKLESRKTDSHRSKGQTKRAELGAGARKSLEEAMLRGASAARKDDAEENHRPRSKTEIAAMPVEAVLDLHGVKAAEAQTYLSIFFLDASKRGLKKVLVIHGKGLHSQDAPVLGDTVRRFLETSPLAGRHGVADRRSGGSGAVWVLIKGYDQRSR